VPGQQVSYEVLGTWIWHRANLYQLLGISTPARYSRYDDTFADSFGSFDELRDRQALNVRPSRIEVVTPARPMSLSDLIARNPGVVVEPRKIALINAVGLEDQVASNRLVKLIEGDAVLLTTTTTRRGR